MALGISGLEGIRCLDSLVVRTDFLVRTTRLYLFTLNSLANSSQLLLRKQLSMAQVRSESQLYPVLLSYLTTQARLPPALKKGRSTSNP